MTLPTMPAEQAGERAHSFTWILAVTLVAIAAVIAISAIVGMAGPSPTYEIVPDPAGLSIPF